MNKKVIRLGDEILDVTTQLRGICIGQTVYLSGVEYWILQPGAGEDAERPREVLVEKNYCEYVGTGVYPDPAPKVMGFHAGSEAVNGGKA